MVIAIGVDIVQVSRVSGVLGRHGRGFLRRILHHSEIATYAALSPAKKDHFVAGAWAAKEALYKTLDDADQRKFAFREWYRYTDGKRPGIARAEEPGCTPVPPGHVGDEFLLSISHDNDMLVATVLRQRRPRK